MGKDRKSDTPISFVLDGKTVAAAPGETIWQVAQREGVAIPHLCHCDSPGYRPDGNCRICMVEIEGERILAPSCRREPAPGMVVKTRSPRAEEARKGVMELLLADLPDPENAHDPQAPVYTWAREMGISASPYPARKDVPEPDLSHPAMAVRLDTCIHCGLCVRACREVQMNNVIGMAGRGRATRVVFDQDDPMGESTCVGCGECVQACPTGALLPADFRKGALVPEQGAKGDGGEERVPSVCPYCGVGCQIEYRVCDNEILGVTGRDGPSNQKRLCVKGRFGMDYIRSKDRLTRPWIRRKDRPKSAMTQLENMDVYPLEELFRPASWEEALDVAASGLKAIRDAHGGNALAGFGSAKCSNEEAYLFQKFMRTGCRTHNVDHCTRLCHASSVAALIETIGSGAVTAPFTQVFESDLIVVIGSNPTENHPVAATYFKQAAARGTCLVVMDPRGHALRDHAHEMLQFRPGRDVALLNAMMHVIVTEDLHDKDFIVDRTTGFNSLEAHLKDFSPEKMAPVCGIDAHVIRRVARKFARASSAMIFWGMGISQHTHGTDNTRCLISLALICGQVGRPGTGLHPLRGQNNVQGASDAGLIPMMFPDYAPVADPDHRDRFEKLWGAPMEAAPGLTVVEVVKAIEQGGIRGMYIMGENPAMSDPDLAHARAALARLEHLVVQDIFPTETVLFADVILPASAWPEKEGTVTNTNRQIQMGRPAVPPPGKARLDWEIIQAMAKGMGLDWEYKGPAHVFEEMKQAMPSLDNISWGRLEREGAVTYPCKGPDQPGEDVVFGDGFPTPDSRGRFIPVDLKDPHEMPHGEYPFILTTGRQLEHWHTGAMTRRANVLDALEPGPTASLHPKTLERLGIVPGEQIRVATPRGEIFPFARGDDAVQPDMVFIPFAYGEAAVNLLTHSALDPWGKIPEFKYCAARVEKMEGRKKG